MPRRGFAPDFYWPATDRMRMASMPGSEEMTKGPWQPMSPARLSNLAYLAAGSAILALALADFA